MTTATQAVRRQPEARLPATTGKLRDDQFGYDQARHLLWRAGFGGTPEQIQTLVGWGLEKSVDYLVNPQKVPFEDPRASSFDGNIHREATEEERLAYRRAQQQGDEEALARLRLERQRRERNDREQMREAQKWWLKRMIETPRPLEEKMTLFWHGHFATSFRKVENSYHMLQQNAMFRTHALGNFGDLLFGIIRDPAMLAYLDNQRSSIRQPNENLARELMELFSLGEGNYSEKDIKEGARALTGHTFEGNEFRFVDRNHDKGSKSILGKSGNLDGDDFVRAILESRDCSRFLAIKLYRHFIGDVPLSGEGLDPARRAYINRLASTILESRYELRPVLRRLFISEHFYHPSNMHEQIKSPVQLVVGSVRSLLTPVRDLSVLNDALDLMGQSLFFPPSVKGWDGGRSWINTSTLFVRQNIMAYLLTGKMPQGYDRSADTQKYDSEPLLGELAKADPAAPRDPQKVVEYVLRFTLGHAPSQAKETLLSFIAGHGNRITPDIVTGSLMLVTAMPEYQLC